MRKKEREREREETFQQFIEMGDDEVGVLCPVDYTPFIGSGSVAIVGTPLSRGQSNLAAGRVNA